MIAGLRNELLRALDSLASSTTATAECLAPAYFFSVLRRGHAILGHKAEGILSPTQRMCYSNKFSYTS